MTAALPTFSLDHPAIAHKEKPHYVGSGAEVSGKNPLSHGDSGTPQSRHII